MKHKVNTNDLIEIYLSLTNRDLSRKFIRLLSKEEFLKCEIANFDYHGNTAKFLYKRIKPALPTIRNYKQITNKIEQCIEMYQLRI